MLLAFQATELRHCWCISERTLLCFSMLLLFCNAEQYLLSLIPTQTLSMNTWILYSCRSSCKQKCIIFSTENEEFNYSPEWIQKGSLWKKKTNINGKLSWLKLVSNSKYVYIWVRKTLASVISNGNLRKSDIHWLRVLRSSDFQQAIK